jgi:aryl-alcohol dehydrogenase-like predicted oxidoreductase
MPKIAIGTANFGMQYGVANSQGKLSKNSVAEILGLAKSLGVTCLDTANAYGESQKVLGEFGVRDWRVVSKISSIPRDCEDVRSFVRAEIDLILTSLNLSEFDTVLVHNPKDLMGNVSEIVYEELQKAKSRGQVEKIGVSIYDPSDLESITSRFQLDVVQAPINVFDSRLQDSGWLDRLVSMGVEVHARSVFLQGVLLSAIAQSNDFFKPWKTTFEKWNRFAESSGTSAMMNCIKHVNSYDKVTFAVVGVDSAQNLSEVFDAFTARPQRINEDNFGVDSQLINPARWSIV